MFAPSLLQPSVGRARRGTGVCRAASRHDNSIDDTCGFSRNSVNGGALQEEAPLSSSKVLTRVRFIRHMSFDRRENWP